jgi:hypothetical protein
MFKIALFTVFSLVIIGTRFNPDWSHAIVCLWASATTGEARRVWRRLHPRRLA